MHTSVVPWAMKRALKLVPNVEQTIILESLVHRYQVVLSQPEFELPRFEVFRIIRGGVY
ncbi:hypothetical protein BKA67DRAFT_579931 [Truncatella angustata]|uniref:Uncharacterized protein n=1 Tax=Truncatella angustata TaxID=152316 RepID=A0A9P8RNN4_9PEZI|nr:uncharacterized protein BKA67DRAFT_579931 [Truncatella angustata]KAH6646540.1 hypothetical protein BKA67DRAFT_579931 [Truncatella angustata]